MASFKDLSFVSREYGFGKYLKRVYNEINSDNVFTQAAAMAYAWVFAVFPLIIVLLTLIPYIPEKFRKDAHGAIIRIFQQSGMPHHISKSIVGTVDKVMNDTHTGLLSIGLALTIYAASGGMNMTMSALDVAIDCDRPRSYIIKRLVALGLTIVMLIGFGVVLLMFPIATSARNIVTENIHHLPDYWRDLFSGPSLFFMDIARYAVGLLAVLVMIGVLYNFGPSRRHKFRLITPGATFVIFGWLITGWGLRFYFDHFANYSKTYGAVAGVVIMMMVFYLDATIILVGAEIDSEIDNIKRERTIEAASAKTRQEK